MAQPYSKVGANDNLMRQQFMLMKQLNVLTSQLAAPATQRKTSSTLSTRDIDEAQYKMFKGPLHKTMQKMMWPSMIGGMMFDWDKQISSMVKSTIGKDISPILEKAMGPGLALTVGLPSALSALNKTKRLPYEKHLMPQLGAVGQAARLLDMFSLSRHLGYRLPKTIAMLAGGKQLADKFIRPEQLMTGAATGTYGLAKKAGKAAGGLVDTMTGGFISKGVNAIGGTKIGAAAGGLAKKAFAGIDSSILSALGSPMGLSMVLAGAQVGLSILKSMKIARLFPTKKSIAKLSREFSITLPNAQIAAQIDALAQTGRVKPEQLNFMMLRLIEFNTRATEQQIAGFRSEYVSEVDYTRQEKEKGTDRFGEAYESNFFGRDNRSLFGKVVDKIEGSLINVMEKYNPFQQIGNFVFGLLKGKIILPKHEQSRIAASYGFKSEREMVKGLSSEFKTSFQQTRLLMTDSAQIRRMAPQNQEIALLSAQFDIQRLMASELVTVRKGMGFDSNILYRGAEKEGIFQDLKNVIKRFSPANLPGINALWNLTKLPFKYIFQTGPQIAKKSYDLYLKGLEKIKDVILGKEYKRLQDTEELLKEAGLYKPLEQESQEFITKGLPQHLELIRGTLLQQTEIQSNIFNILNQQLEISGGMYDYISMSKKQKEPLVWDLLEGQYVTAKIAEMLKKSRFERLLATKEKGFREGPMGKLMQFLDTLWVGSKKADELERAEKRMEGVERLIQKRQEIETGAATIYPSSGVVRRLMEERLTGVHPTKVMKPISKKEIEYMRSLETLPETFFWKMRRVVAGMVPILGPLFYTRARQKVEILGPEKREEEIESRTELEREIEQSEKFFWKTPVRKLAGQNLPKNIILSKKQAQTGVPAQTNALTSLFEKYKNVIDSSDVKKGDFLKVSVLNFEDLKNMLPDWSILSQGGIAPSEYLGENKGHNIFTLLKPGQPYAEVTIVDKEGNPVFIGGGANQSGSFMDDIVSIKKALTGEPTSIADLLDPNKPETAQVSVLKAAAEGMRISEGDKNKPVLVGEKGPEILMPRSAGVIIPNDQIQKFADGGIVNGGVFEEIKAILEEQADIQRETLMVNTQAIQIDQDRTVQQELQEVEQKKKEEEQKTTQRGILDTLKGIYQNTKEKIFGGKKSGDKDKKGMSLFDLLLGGLASGALAALIGGLTWAISDAIKDFKNKDWKQVIIDFFIGDMENSLGATGKTVGKWALIGAGVGKFIGPVGMIGGALLGAGFGALLEGVKSTFLAYKEGGIGQALETWFLGDKEGGLKSAIQGVGKYAAMGATVGAILGFGVPGAIAGAVGGGIIGAVLGFIGADKIKSAVEYMANLSPNAYLLNMFEDMGIGEYGMKLATWGSVIPVIGPIVGMVVGSAMDVVSGVFSIAFKVGDWIGKILPTPQEIAGKMGDPGTRAYDWAITGAGIVPIIGGYVGGFVGALADGLESIFGDIAKVWKWIKEKIDPYLKPFKNLFSYDESYKPPEDTALLESMNYKKATEQVKKEVKAAIPVTPTTAVDAKQERIDYLVKSGINSDEAKKIVEEEMAREGKVRQRKITGKSEWVTPSAQPAGVPTTVKSGDVGVPSPATPSAQPAGVPTTPPKKENLKKIPEPLNLNVKNALTEASEKTGVPLNTLSTIAYIESKFNPLARNGNAYGLFQFMKKTWRDITTQKGKKYGITPETSPLDARANALMGGELIKDDSKRIESTVPNPPPTLADIYTAHFFGAGDVVKFFREMKKDPNQIGANVLPGPAESNPNIFYVDGNKSRPRTLAQIYQLMGQKTGVDVSRQLADLKPPAGEPTKEQITQKEFEMRRTGVPETELTRAREMLIEEKKKEQKEEQKKEPFNIMKFLTELPAEFNKITTEVLNETNTVPTTVKPEDVGVPSPTTSSAQPVGVPTTVKPEDVGVVSPSPGYQPWSQSLGQIFGKAKELQTSGVTAEQLEARRRDSKGGINWDNELSRLPNIEQVNNEKIEEKVTRLGEKMKETVGKIEDEIKTNVIPQVQNTIATMPTPQITNIRDTAVDPFLDSLINRLFSGASMLFSSEFKEYTYDSGINHSFNI